LIRGIDQANFEDPERFASELFKSFGTEALRYYVVIVKYADSGKFNAEGDAEEEAEKEELKSIMQQTESASNQEADNGASA
jgi:cysteinyl-tRNA synthetase